MDDSADCLRTVRPAPGMRFVDALPWSRSFAFKAFGVSVGIRWNEPGLWPSIEAILPPGRKPISRAAVDRLYSLRRCVESGIHSTRLFGRFAELSPSLDVELAVEENTPRGLLAAIARICPEIRDNVFRGDGAVFPSVLFTCLGTSPDSFDAPLPAPELGSYRLYRGGRLIAASTDLAEVVGTLEEDISLYLAAWSDDHLFLHAGVVGWRGRCVLIPGPSGAGKSSLVAALLRAGASYHSDEFAPLDAQGRVVPFARPLFLRSGDGRHRVDPAEFGAPSGQRALPVGLVVLTRYEAGRRWRPEELPPGLAALKLLRLAVPARRRPRDALRLLAAIVGSAPCLEGARGEADETAELVLRACGEWSSQAAAVEVQP